MLFFIAMEYFDGKSLKEIIEQKKKEKGLQDKDKITIIKNILEALEYIHS